MSEVKTVLGPVKRESLGITLPHEHIFIDLSCLWHQPLDPCRAFLVDAPVEAANRALLLRDPYHSRDNVKLDEPDLLVAELSRFKELGGRTVVDLSTRDIGPYPQKLKEVALRTGLNIVAGTGFYTRIAHPHYVRETPASKLAEQMIAELTLGFAGTDICAGLIGEIGTSSPIDADELKVLEAVAFAHRETGAAINIHLAIFGGRGREVLDLLISLGIDPQYVALSHLDEISDSNYHLELAKRGCFIEFDCFGSEVYFDEDGLREPSDAERISSLLFLLEQGYEKQLLLSQDVCTKMQLRQFGGMGYDHILRSIVPRLLACGVAEQSINTMLVENPARFICGRPNRSWS